MGINKWLGIQAAADVPQTCENVKRLLSHETFSLSNPNSVRALIGTFARNPSKFHAADGSGYELVRGVIQKVCGFNPQMAAALAKTMSDWRRFDEGRQDLMKESLSKIMATEKLPKDVYEIVKRSLD